MSYQSETFSVLVIDGDIWYAQRVQIEMSTYHCDCGCGDSGIEYTAWDEKLNCSVELPRYVGLQGVLVAVDEYVTANPVKK